MLEAPDAIKKWRTLMGATDPAKADPGTIRKEFASSIGENATHGSDAPETAAFEIGYFFAGTGTGGPIRAGDAYGQSAGRRRSRAGAPGLLVMAGFPLFRLPGDFTVRRGPVTFFFPLASSILLSILFTLLLLFLRR